MELETYMTCYMCELQGKQALVAAGRHLLSQLVAWMEQLEIDDVISQAQATRTALGSQRTLFGDVQGKVTLLGHKFPVIRGLLGSIKRKRSRDALILSADIAACTLFLIIYWLSK